MKKSILAAVAALGCACAFAALNVAETRFIPVIGPASVSSGTTNTAVVAVRELKGIAGLNIQANASRGRSLDVTMWKTNTVDGGWSLVAHHVFDNTNACVDRVFFNAEYLTPFVKVSVGSLGGASVIGANIESY